MIPVNGFPADKLSFGFLLAVGVVLSGCFEDGPSKPPLSSGTLTESSSQTATSTQTSTAPVHLTSAIPSAISWNECHGTGGSIPYGNHLLSLNQGETPPGWEAPPGDNSNYIFFMSTCERISLGNLERGPASFLFEIHWGLFPPESCREFEPGYEYAAVILSIWVDDAEVAAVLRDDLQMPVVVGEFSSEIVPQGDAELHTWTWKADGAEESTITVGHPGGQESPGAPVDRFVWHNGTGVSFLDLAQDRLLPDAFVPTAQGMLAPPMRYAETAGPTPFVGATSVWKQGDFYGPIYRFGDMACKQPLS